MSQFDISCWKIILVLAGLTIVVAELCLLCDEWLTGAGGGFPAWARGLMLLAGLAVILATLGVRRR